MQSPKTERDGPVLLRAEPCAGDYVLLTLTVMVATNDFDYIEPSYLDAFKAMQQHKEALEAHELYVAYKGEYAN